MNQDLMTRQAFWLLQKYSSYTWNAEIARHYTKLTYAFWQALRRPPSGFLVSGREICMLQSLWQYQKLYEDGLSALLRGYKYPGYGKLQEGFKFPRLFFFDPIDNKEPTYIDPAGLQYHLGLRNMGEMCEGMFRNLSFGRAMHFSGTWYSKEEFLNTINRISDQKPDVPGWLPHSPPDLPTPPEIDIVSNTGDKIAVTGIWQAEPLVPFTKRELAKLNISSETYWMNFFAEGVKAPSVSCQEIQNNWYASDGPYYRTSRPRDIDMKKNVRWKLIWKDDRYGANGIPAEEADYLRLI